MLHEGGLRVQDTFRGAGALIEQGFANG